MLARLDEIDGVERSFVNRAGTLIRLSVSATADADAVAARVVNVLAEEADDRLPTRFSEDAVGKTLAAEEWRDATRVAELSAIELRTLMVRLAVVLLLVVAVVSLWWLWKQRRVGRTG